ncbi:MAG: histidine phosphatase family protein [Candidatus Promineifilaceae bacterium]
MKTLLLLRHAKSSWANAQLADHDRPLNGRGKGDAPKMGRLLDREELVPDLIISSSAERALTTAELAALSAGYNAEIQVVRALYLADPEDYIELLQQVSDNNERVMAVGHNPGIEELQEQLSGHYQRMSTAALAQIELPINHWGELDEEINGHLINLWLPKEL